VIDRSNGAGLRLRPATAQDRMRIRRWLVEPQARAWWGDAASAEAEISLAMGSQAALCRIVEEGAAPIGYGQAVDCGLWWGPLPQALPAGTWEIDLLIVSEQRRRQSLAAALALLVEEVFATTLAIACCGLVPISDEAAARAYERAQFRWREIWNDPLLGPTWVMLRERPS
jgi:ribosomal protein S18 acetylase RimI-like enzyme